LATEEIMLHYEGGVGFVYIYSEWICECKCWSRLRILSLQQII